MSDELALHKDMDRAARAERLLTDEMLQEAFDSLDNLYTQHWKDSPVLDSVGREKLWQAIQVLQKVKGHLKSVLQNGAVAAAELSQLTK